MLQILLLASLGQCPGGQCQVPPPQPVRQAVYATATAVQTFAAPKCEQKGLFVRIAERREARKAKCK